MSRVMVAGVCLGVTREKREWDGREWIDTTVHVLSGLESTQVLLGREFPENAVPQRGEVVAFDAQVRAFQRRSGISVTIEAAHRLTAVEDVLPASVYDLAVPA